MVNFYNTGIDTADLTIFLVILGLIITPILVLGVYHLQKSRPKIKIRNYSSNHYHPETVGIIVYVKNIGDNIAEEIKYEMTSMTKGVAVDQNSTQSTDLLPNSDSAPGATVSIKEGENCKIKIKISWDNHTLKLKKRNNLTQEFTCDRIADHDVRFENS